MAHNARKHARPAKSKGKNNGPSRQSYWASGRLQAHKVKALMKHNGMTKEAATRFWLAARHTRKK